MIVGRWQGKPGPGTCPSPSPRYGATCEATTAGYPRTKVSMMKGFILGIVTVLLLLAGGLVLALMGFVGMRADNPPSKFETIVAGHAMDASVARAAPKIANPVMADEATWPPARDSIASTARCVTAIPRVRRQPLLIPLIRRATVHEG